MPQFKSIVLTTDLSENAEAAAPYALEMAAKFGSTVHLVHVFEDILQTGILADGSMGYNPAQWLLEAESDRHDRLNILASSITTPENVRLIPHFLGGVLRSSRHALAAMQRKTCVLEKTLRGT